MGRGKGEEILQKKNEAISEHPEFYFSDGSVIIIVEKTAFRIHQTVLSRHSDVFAGMFTLPQPEKADTIDGCPIVSLTDLVEDFVDVMKAIYNTFHFDELSSDADLGTAITFISGILRISTKYNMQLLRSKCISIIQEKFPATLAGCDKLIASQSMYEPSAIVRVIPLAYEANIPAVLPWAYYLCTHIPTPDLMKNPVLSWKDKALCLAGKERLWDAQKTFTPSLLFEFSRAPQCMTACQPRLPQMGWRDTETLRACPHPLATNTVGVTAGLQLCIKCMAHVENQQRKGREKVWEILPDIFELGTWDDILKEQNC